MALRNRPTILIALAFAVIVLSAALFFAVRPLLAQTSTTPTCSTGAAVPNPANNPGLVSDCEALLASRDTLRGDRPLNWSENLSIYS